MIPSRLTAMVTKEFLATLRDPRSRIILVIPPLVLLFILGFATTLEVRNVDIGIWNQDGGPVSAELIQRIAGSPNVAEVVPLYSRSAVQEAINAQRVLAVVVFDTKFSADILAGEGATMQVILDGRKSNSAQIFEGYLSQIVTRYGAELQERPRTGEVILTHWFNPNLRYLWFTMPGLIVIITTISGLGLTAQTVARERELGSFEQLLVSPLNVAEILTGKLIPPVIFGLINATLYIVLIAFVFGVPLTGSVPLLYVSMLFYLLALAGIGLFVSSLAMTQQQGFMGMFMIAVPAILLSGYASPVENMPLWLQWITAADPARHFLDISEGIFLRDMPATEIAHSIFPLIIIAGFTLSAAAVLFRRRME